MADSTALHSTAMHPVDNMVGPVRLLTAKEVASVLAISVSEVYNLANAGRLTKGYIGKGKRNFRIRSDEVRAYIDSLPTEPLDDGP